MKHPVPVHTRTCRSPRVARWSAKYVFAPNRAASGRLPPRRRSSSTGLRACGRHADTLAVNRDFLPWLGRPESGNSGQVLIGETDLASLSDRERTLLRRDRLGFQSFNLMPTLTAGLAGSPISRPAG